jgi:hypothetical protein
MPVVDSSKNMKRALGINYVRTRPTVLPGAGDGDGQFRIACAPSHMSNDDPIVYPNQQGAAHHHSFFGNTSLDFKSDPMTLADVGNSTCMGGIANRSAYWVPSLIDTETNTPLLPNESLWYYKTGYVVPKQYITAPAKGLRLIAGNAKATNATQAKHFKFYCRRGGSAFDYGTTIPVSCNKAGDHIALEVNLPQCWDGKNLDSPNHQDHMAYTNQQGGITPNNCPATHPVAIPRIDLNLLWRLPRDNMKLRLASDNYTYNGSNAGYSAHADWMNGWQEDIMRLIIKNCLNGGKDCEGGMLGDGKVLDWLPDSAR